MFSISNLAWDITSDNEVAKVLNNFGVEFIDIAPTKYFSDLSKVTNSELDDVKDYWTSNGISIRGMQSLLFGMDHLNVFSDEFVQEQMLEYFSNICHVGSRLGATRLVFGSPRNRDSTGLSNQESLQIAKVFFKKLGSLAKSYDVIICLEPNPACYNSNFMTNSLDTLKVVQAVEHPNIRMQLDVGAMCINNEEPYDVIKMISPYVEHIHVSEPNLAPLDFSNPYHQKVSDAINKYLPDVSLAIEMLSSTQENSIKEIENALALVKLLYRRES